MKKKIAINGFGRIGRLLLRQVLGQKEIEVVAINDLGEADNLAYLFKYDTVYGRWPEEVRAERGNLVVGRKKIRVLNEKDPSQLPWKQMKIDLAVEATGVFDSYAKAQAHIKAGALRTVITAPARDEEGVAGGRTVLVGVNDEKLGKSRLTCNGSCTTNAVAIVMKILNEKLGVKKAMLNTIHGYTASQNLVDGPRRGSWQRGRAAAQNLVLTSTGAALSVTRGLPELVGRFEGIATRVPVVSGSAADITVVTEKTTSREEVNRIFKKAKGDKKYKGVLSVTEEPVVSSDIIGQPYGAIVDLSFTRVADGNLVKVLSWYDNEWGYVAVLVKHIMEALKGKQV